MRVRGRIYCFVVELDVVGLCRVSIVFAPAGASPCVVVWAAPLRFVVHSDVMYGCVQSNDTK